ncbi:MAG: DUF3298 domain-containing protein [Bacteroidales bacterium]|nr:DUF3298 domain-containing protein [Bacteroidales bacterium]
MTLKSNFIAAAAFCLILLSSCKGSEIKTRTFNFDNTGERSDFTMLVELPLSTRGVAGEIRNQLIDIMDHQLSSIGLYDGGRMFPKYDGDLSNTADLLEYYCRKGSEAIETHAMDFYNEVKQNVEDEEELEFIPRCEYDFTLGKVYESTNFVVYLSEDYNYMGGAHGGVSGMGDITFDKRNGKIFDNFLKADALEPMQGLLEKGLAEYFEEPDGSDDAASVRERLFLYDGDTTIPFPAWTPSPDEYGLSFTYQQYEIAAYAMGMPSFTIPYDEVKPFLTPEAIELLNLK